MRADSVSRTAQGAATVRAIEMNRPPEDRLFEDPFARRMLKPMQRLIIDVMRLLRTRESSVREWRAYNGIVRCRTRYIDDRLRDALGKGLEQVVILGAGLIAFPESTVRAFLR